MQTGMRRDLEKLVSIPKILLVSESFHVTLIKADEANIYTQIKTKEFRKS
jgi:hypothetical protein